MAARGVDSTWVTVLEAYANAGTGRHRRPLTVAEVNHELDLLHRDLGPDRYAPAWLIAALVAAFRTEVVERFRRRGRLQVLR